MHTKSLAILAVISLAAATLAACAPALADSSPTQQVASPTTAPPSNPCDNSLVPVKLGATWTYANSSAGTNSFNFSAAIRSVRPDGFTAAMDFGDNLSVDQHWNCAPEGLVATTLGSGQAGLALALEGISANVTTSNPVGVTIPADVQPGMSWTSGLDLAGTLTQGVLGSKASGNVTTAMQAAGTESVTVPAGTFNAMKVLGTSTFNVSADYHGLPIPLTSVINTTLWFAPGVGLVKSTASGEFAGSKLDLTSELQSYNIP